MKQCMRHIVHIYITIAVQVRFDKDMCLRLTEFPKRSYTYINIFPFEPNCQNQYSFIYFKTTKVSILQTH